MVEKEEPNVDGTPKGSCGLLDWTIEFIYIFDRAQNTLDVY